MSKRLHLFQGYGIELEYMIVDRETLDILPVADELIRIAAGNYSDDFVNGPVTWSNEMVLHLIELKCTEPVKDLVQLGLDLEENISRINRILRENFNGRLMPTAAHPWMNPAKETRLWPYGSSGIYRKYDEIFNCKGHGWSNLQSTHINLPFFDDEEFAPLHTAIRLILPLIPGLAASSPILDMNYTGYHDTRLTYYETNQKRLPAITGMVIPEKVTSRRQYQKYIYQEIAEQLKPFDPKQMLDPVWVNSRGAIARFDRGSLEIRLMDVQESPKADLAICSLIIGAIRLFVDGKLANFDNQYDWDRKVLYEILQNSIRNSSSAVVNNEKYLALFGIEHASCTVTDIWQKVFNDCLRYYPKDMEPWKDVLEILFNRGSLASGILQLANGTYSKNNLKLIYQELCENLDQNNLLEVCDHSILS